MIDLHCHILPGIDDGAKNVVDSLELISMELSQNIDKLVFTPHFNIDQIPLQDFLQRRGAALDLLLDAATAKGFELPQYKCAAEVYLTPKLLEADLKSLCIEGTDYMLVELPADYYRQWTQDVLYNIRMEGITPILAHVERYEYFSEAPDKLYKLICEGALAQANASTIIKHNAKQVLTYLKHNMVHVLSSDTHSIAKRPPLLGPAMAVVRKKVGDACADMLMDTAARIFDGDEISPDAPTEPKKLFGFVF
ncbi:MAG: CpsB/CapC family capsule biosynthesis tyrosine phosphatase [Oscillospiraceae bacterium]